MSSLENIVIKKAILTPDRNKSGNDSTVSPDLDTEADGIGIEKAITAVDYFEDILSPSVSCYLKISDTANLYNSAPIRGNERLDLVIGTSYGDFEYTDEKPFYVVGVQDLIQSEGSETFTMQLATQESFNNETSRCYKRYRRYPIHQHVRDILENTLDVKEDRIKTIEKTMFSFDFIGNFKKPFYTCTWLAPKSVPIFEGAQGKSGKGKLSRAKGTAGFFFYEDYDGFHFRSMEKMLDAVESGAEDGKVPEYVSSSITEREATDRQIIHSYMSANTHIQKNLRIGLYANLTYFFEPLSWEIDAIHYRMQEEIDNNTDNLSLDKQMDGKPDVSPKLNMLGGRTPIPKDLVNDASRILVRLGDTGMKDDSLLKDQDGDLGDSGRDPADMAKSFSRYNLLFQQSLNIVIPINTNIRVGGIIKVVLPSVGPAPVGDAKPADNESSGYYLIRCLRHHFEISGGQNTTSLNLVRDSYGLS